MPAKKQNPELITVDFVKDLKRRGIEFRVRYELVEPGEYGRRPPRYRCIYEFGEGREGILVGSRFNALTGVDERHFLLWPGLVSHHRELGDGRPLCLFVDDFTLVTGDVQTGSEPALQDAADRQVDVARPEKRTDTSED